MYLYGSYLIQLRRVKKTDEPRLIQSHIRYSLYHRQYSLNRLLYIIFQFSLQWYLSHYHHCKRSDCMISCQNWKYLYVCSTRMTNNKYTLDVYGRKLIECNVYEWLRHLRVTYKHKYQIKQIVRMVKFIP